jgi:hypothetical protein
VTVSRPKDSENVGAQDDVSVLLATGGAGGVMVSRPKVSENVGVQDGVPERSVGNGLVVLVVGSHVRTMGGPSQRRVSVALIVLVLVLEVRTTGPPQLIVSVNDEVHEMVRNVVNGLAVGAGDGVISALGARVKEELGCDATELDAVGKTLRGMIGDEGKDAVASGLPGAVTNRPPQTDSFVCPGPTEDFR